jgi:hypothetical protein
MARLKRDVVSYFPHDASSSDGDTLTIIEGQFGDKGYVFWFKLLERLCLTDGHAIYCNNSVKWQLLLVKLHVTEELGISILNRLADLDAIDKQLWTERVIWSQHLVDNVTDAYTNRKRLPPKRPLVSPSNRITTDSNAITTDESTQSKLKETKVNKSKLYKREVADSVLMTEEQLGKLIAQFGEEGAKNRIEKLSLYILSTGKHYKSHFHTILNWERNNQEGGNGHKPGTGNSGANPKQTSSAEHKAAIDKLTAQSFRMRNLS